MSAHALVSHESTLAQDRWSDPIRGEVRFVTMSGDGSGTESLTSGVAELDPGEWLGEHRHASAEVYYILEGGGTLVSDGHEQILVAGSSVYLPPNLAHGVFNTGEARLRIFYVLAADRLVDVKYRFLHADG